MNDNSKPLQVIGIDASGVACLCQSLRTIISESEKIAAPKRLLKSVENWHKIENPKSCPPEFFETDNIQGLLHWIKKDDKKTTILASGDPLWFGIGRLIVDNFEASKVCFHPSPASFQIAFSRIGIPWQNSCWISLHGRDPYQLANSLKTRPSSLIVLTDPNRAGAKEIKKFLSSSGLEKAYALWVFEKLGHPEERIHKISHKDKLPENIDPLHLVILIEEKQSLFPSNDLPLFGIEDGIFAQYEDCPGLMTKKEIRVQILADLELPQEGVIWDIGAGVGSIGLEALRLRPKLKLVSIEKRVGSKKLIQKNAQILGVNPTAIYEREILDFLQKKDSLSKEISSPDRVIIGGGGLKNKEILVEILKHIKRDCIIVIPLATISSISYLIHLLELNSKNLSISQTQAYRGVPISKDIRFNPLNPVFILKARL